MLDHFFLNSAVPAYAEMGTYVPLLVLASYAVAVFGSYAGLTLAVQLFVATTTLQKRILHWAGAFALGGGIWSMHFIGMLAYEMPMDVHYDPLLTLLSMLIVIAVAFCVLQLTQVAHLSRLRLTAGAVALGIGIASMHYIGMAAMRMDADVQYRPGLFLLSILIAIAASGAALGIISTLGRRKGRRQILWRAIAAMVMGIAICGMHYTGMAAAVFMPHGNYQAAVGKGSEFLAMGVIASTMILLTILTLAISRRLFLILGCGILFSLPLVIIVYQATTELNAEIAVAKKERFGVQYHNKLVDLLQHVQEACGLTNAVRNGDAEFAGQLESAREKTREMIAQVDSVDKLYGMDLAASQGWQAIRSSILSLLADKDSPPPREEFKRYSDAIETLSGFMEDVADNSSLSTDSRLDSDYLADAAVHVTPSIIETIGRMRGLTVGLLASGKPLQQWTDQDVRELQAFYNALNVEDEDMENALERARHANADSAAFIDYHDKTIEPKLDEFQKHFEQMLFARTNNASAAGVFQEATALINLYDALYDKTSDKFLDLLRQRQEDYTLKRNLVLYSSVVAFLGFFALFIFLYRALAKTQQAEQELKKRHAELVAAKKIADAASVAKSDFLANMSHELRTPLNSILGINRLLLESGLTDEQHSMADTVFRSSVNLLEIVNDILDLSKIEAGEMELERIGFDLRYVLHSVVHAMDHIAREKRIPIVRHYEKENFPYVIGDPTRLGRVLMNLIGNAVKYTDHGHVDVRIFCKPLEDRRVEFRGEISDTGIGIPQNKLGSIFEKFVQADTSTTRKYGGTGLGLAITRQLVELMGGAIGVESEVGVGSTFWFTIPFEVTDKLHEDKHVRRQKALLGTIPPEKARVLVAEDHPMNQILIRKLLAKFGIPNIRIVENGLDALKAGKEEAWDVVLMDCHMPEKNGYDTAKDIRDLEKATGAHVPIVAMTANAMVGDREKCLRYGMDEYVSKPINADELKDVLGQWIQFQDEPPPLVDAAPKNEEPVNLTQIRTFSEGGKDMERELVGVFITQSDKNLKTLKDHCIAGECKPWIEAAHMLKGGAAGIGASSLSKLCHQGQLMTDCGAGERAALFDKIADEYGRVKDYLRQSGLLS